MKENNLEIVNNSMTRLDEMANNVLCFIRDELEKSPDNKESLLEIMQMVNAMASYNDLGQQELHKVIGNQNYDFGAREANRAKFIQEVMDNSHDSQNSNAFR